MVHIVENDKHKALRLGHERNANSGIANAIMDNNDNNTVHDSVHDDRFEKRSIRSQHGNLLTLLAYAPHSTFAELANTTGLHPKTVQRRIKELQELGKLKREGSDRKGSWVIIDE
jgi:predicted HTH transcriptional regulator